MPTKQSSPRSDQGGQHHSSGRPTAKLILSGIQAYGFHGHNPAERQMGQPFSADVELSVDSRRAAASDDLDHTLSYPIAERVARQILEGEPVNLLETVAERIASALLELPGVFQVSVRVTKRPPVPHLTAFTVEITRPVEAEADRQ